MLILYNLEFTKNLQNSSRRPISENTGKIASTVNTYGAIVALILKRFGEELAMKPWTDKAIRPVGGSSGPHHQDSGEAKIRESSAGVSRKPSSDGKARGSSSKHLCGLTAWNT